MSRRGGSPLPTVQAHACDLLDPAAVEQLVASVRPTHLLHLAWYAEHGSYWTSEENLRWVEASLALARSVRRHGGSRIVVAGTCAEYDWSVGDCTETGPAAPATLYGTAKHALQLTLSAWAAQVGISLGWGRIFFLYGPHEDPRRLVASVIRALLAGQDARCTAGTQLRDFQHVSDTGGAMAALLDSEVAGIVNVASGRAVSIREVVIAIADRLDAHAHLLLGAREMAPGDPAVLRASVSRLHDEVGWQDRHDLAAGIDDAIRWWRSQEAPR